MTQHMFLVLCEGAPVLTIDAESPESAFLAAHALLEHSQVEFVPICDYLAEPSELLDNAIKTNPFVDEVTAFVVKEDGHRVFYLAHRCRDFLKIYEGPTSRLQDVIDVINEYQRRHGDFWNYLRQGGDL